MMKIRGLYKALLLGFAFLVHQQTEAQIYVAVNGSDKAPGTKEKPLATLQMALRKLRDLRRLNDPSLAQASHIYVNDGLYQLKEPILVRPEDGGTTEIPTTINAVSGEQPIFSGGVKINGWRKAEPIKYLPSKAQGKIWVADAPRVGNQLLDFRQLWVNNQKAIRARDKNADSMYRILSWNHQTEQCWIPKPRTDISNAQGLEITIIQWWAIANLRIKSFRIEGDSVLLSFHQPESRIQSEHPWPAPWISAETGNSAFFLSNSLTFLDEPGEWFLDQQAGKIYYWPRSNENMNAVSVTAPYLETLLKLQGTIDHPVSNFQIKGISFQHSSWMRPSQQGHVPHQLGMYMLDAYKLKIPGTADKKNLENQAWVGRPAAAVSISYADHILIEDCRFEHLASTGVDLAKGVLQTTVKGNLLRDIGGNAILAGWFSDENTEVHLPYLPKDEREMSSKLDISNNLINDAANEDWGCAGIGAGYIRNSRIDHNDISELPYMGISLGWGWTKTENVMKNNRVEHNRIMRFARQLYDVAGIYTLSAQPGTIISNNYIDSAYKAPYAHLPSHWFYIYTDEGSSSITVKNNWTPSEKYLQNANGPGNIWENNGPAVDEKIKSYAGLEPGYTKLLNERKILYPSQAIVHEQPVIFELIAADMDLRMLKDLLIQNNVNPDAVYQWKDHYVIFDKVQDVSVLKGKIENAFPGAVLKIYYDAFYEFNRQHCSDKSTAKDWDHIILTVNLVNDPKLQKEYINHHASQFQKWPEVSKGFCNAAFQRLLIYRNGRQLMLVISIPKGASLDELNPKTTENNPGMDRWNALMKKYQEGVQGTRPGETWVFLKQLSAN